LPLITYDSTEHINSGAFYGFSAKAGLPDELNERFSTKNRVSAENPRKIYNIKFT
jgi:hypothetical protein